MARIQELQKVASEKIQEWQMALDAKGYAHLGLGVAAGVMFLVFCPMSIVAVATPYWTYSSEASGATVSAKASLWEISLSTEIQGSSSEAEMKMCSDEMQAFDDCGKIDAVRFFLITALLLSLASACCFAIAFSPKLKPTVTFRRKMTITGASLAAVTLVWDFLSVCLAASVDMTENYTLNGVGFVFLVLELFLVTLAVVLAVCTVTRWSASAQPVTETRTEKEVKAQPPSAAQATTPTLLTAAGASAEGVSVPKTNIEVPAEEQTVTTV